MKKVIFTLALIAICSIGFSQIQYEVRNVQLNGTPSVNADSTASVYPYIITVGIVGDKYGFTSPTPGRDVISVTFSYKVKYSDDEKYKIAWVAADAWVAEHYK